MRLDFHSISSILLSNQKNADILAVISSKVCGKVFSLSHRGFGIRCLDGFLPFEMVSVISLASNHHHEKWVGLVRCL